MTTATAQAQANIAFIKYWGNRDNALRVPLNGSISMNLDGLFTQTTVSFQPSLPFDELIINGREVAGPGRERVSSILDIIRRMAGIDEQAEVMTEGLRRRSPEVSRNRPPPIFRKAEKKKPAGFGGLRRPHPRPFCHWPAPDKPGTPGEKGG